MDDWSGLLDGLTVLVRDTFGEAVLYTRGETGEVFDIRAPFDPSHEPLDAGASLKVSSRIPVVEVRLADIGGNEPEEGDEAVIKGVSYRVIDALASSSGMMKAQLRKK